MTGFLSRSTFARAGEGVARARGAFAHAWRGHRGFRLFIYVAAVLILVAFAAWFAIARNLPDARLLVNYQPSLPSVVRGIDGEIVHSFERERRVQLQYSDFPPELVEAYLAAEDKTFFSHGGVDITGTANAVIDYVSKFGSDDRAVGGSTITQQVAKNVLLSNEYSIARKLREMVLARRIEGVLSKEEILTLYLNEIPLGRRSFGVQAAARAYFDKDVDELDLHEMAFLAILPKAPERYGRARFADTAIARRNFVLDQMAENDFVGGAEAEAAKAEPLDLVRQRERVRSADAGYFFEAVRRELVSRFGENKEDGPNSVYSGGLWVRTSLDTGMQAAARDALRAGLLRYHGNRGWTGPVATLNPDNGELTAQLASANLGISYQDWRVGVVTDLAGNGATIGFANGDTAPLRNTPDALRVGDVIAASPEGSGWRVRAVPEISGGFLAQDPLRGRVLAMQGGFDSRLGDFNRATQAERQPGSTIKPFVYATALDNGFTPASEVPDQTFCFYQGANLGEKCFRNFSRTGGGVHTMRWGLEQSRNLMTVHLAMDAGMPAVVEDIRRLGIGDYEPFPAFALGAGETTVERMVTAYSTLANHGRQNRSTTIDYVQDRDGRVIWRADERECTGCNMPEWDGQPMPRFDLSGRQVMDARTAYQVVHMLRGVVERGTATSLRDLELPLFGKTGTTNGPTDVWFVGGSQDVVAGVYMGFDQPRNMGGYAQGGTFAAPIFKQFVTETRDKWSSDPLIAPAGVRMVRIDRRSGKRVFDGWPTDDPGAAVIWEAFKPDTEPPLQTRANEIAARREEILSLIRQVRNAGSGRAPELDGFDEPADFVEEQGGLY
jgi:penicillin-binding protein 1A